MTNYPEIKPNDYQQGTPERALSEYLLAWQKGDWAKMLESTQLAWSSQEKDATEALKSQHELIKLNGAEINGKKDVSELNPSVCQDLLATIFYNVPLGDKKFRNVVKKKKIVVRIICEIAPFKPDKKGRWGVNPISALRKA